MIKIGFPLFLLLGGVKTSPDKPRQSKIVETYSHNQQEILFKARQAFHKYQPKDHAILVINGPDHKRANPLEILVSSYFDHRKQKVYNELAETLDFDQNSIFVYGTNNAQDSLDINTIDQLTQIHAQAPACKKSIIMTGHAKKEGFSVKEKVHWPFKDILSSLDQHYKNQALDLYLFPCNTGAINDHTHGLDSLDQINIYAAAVSGEKSNPFHALSGLKALIQEVQAGLLPDFQDATRILTKHVNSGGKYSVPQITQYDPQKKRALKQDNSYSVIYQIYSFCNYQQQTTTCIRPPLKPS